ncbi:pyruvate dehydrogenase complex dihydrolipoamide acetyltransferase [Paramagnetospirillum magneticum]|uniref:Acetyltransferase component of pyruvate dehydrogenase complex n=1 Tax=Paramagnetospirillum magneticum (strain ATCC 700264 / AMB-1) TaxID=342108 RepID=Q2W4V3_PARM1|nr:pyruvate dehydrogenase complex dihydrolipoamide acetyltransferase [Paramagnetospirillum magneticum]BAE51122.1 Pyruvate/2-oxoglutarate dehydrogenase complex, dihydrolipoamide acyltransferase (E2) component, and related enzyme [Paramagnetospirillum magneticum AMB-1]
MPVQILMPALSPTMTEGNLAKWLKNEGDAVKSGDILCEIETDKATMEFEAVDEGVLGKILVAGGTSGVAVNTPIAVLLEEGEDASAISAISAISAAPAPKAAAPAAAAAPVTAAAPVAAPSGPAHGGDRVVASPLAKRIAKDGNVDLKAVKGSGPHGRIVKADVEAAIKAGPAKPAAAPAAIVAPAAKSAPAPAAASPFEPAFEEIPNSSMRKVIARRLTEAKSTIPHFYLSIDCELDALLKVRADLNGRSDAYKLSVNDFVVRAVALALKKAPAANASWGEEAIKRYTDIDISVAVATPSGLITPIVHHADHKGLAEISNEMKSLAAKARDGKLKPEEFQGGGFTISNLGMFGIKEFAAIINPPQGCILAVGAGEQRPVVKAGALAVATVMTCTLSVDHRVVDGAVGAEFLAAFKKLIEDPLSMLL